MKDRESGLAMSGKHNVLIRDNVIGMVSMTIYIKCGERLFSAERIDPIRGML
ncbi:MAG: hypothetical protein ACOC4C_01940 [Fibrobacterota bacterium]